MAKQFYFAWVDEGEAFNPAVHNREDEDVFSHRFVHVEGDVAGLDIEIRNPRIGLLNAGRKRWAYYSFNKGTDLVPDVVPLFYGRLLGIPSNIFAEVVTIQFSARPIDFVAQKTALAEAMKVLPYYDPIFISPDRWSDPDVVLEGYSLLWHIDPVTHVVSTSDILVPEDGVVDFDEDEIFFDNMQLTMSGVPLTSVRVEAIVPWEQTYTQTINLRRKILTTTAAQFDANYGPLLISYTMEGLISDWPKTGASIGSGWTVALGELTDVSTTNVDVQPIPEIFLTDDLPVLPVGSIFFPLKTTGKFWEGVDGAGYDFQFEIVAVALGYGVPFLHVTADRNVDYGQRIVFTLVADMQDIATAAEEDETLLITMNANRVSDPSEDDEIPIGNVAKRDYLQTPRGLQSIEYCICVARAHLKARARAVQISFEVQFTDLLDLTLKKAVTIHNPRLPGGQATGKIVGITHELNGDTGTMQAVVTIACSVGYGGVRTGDPGDPVWIDDDYIEDDYQMRENEVILLDSSDVTYTVPLVEPDDDGIDFEAGLTPDNIIKSLSVINNADAQKTAVLAAQTDPNGFADQAAISEVLQNTPTQFSLELIDLRTGPHLWDVPVVVSTIVLPKQIDLEAASV
jgi:hypothetical protein